jgi:hypothetical protein
MLAGLGAEGAVDVETGLGFAIAATSFLSEQQGKWNG